MVVPPDCSTGNFKAVSISSVNSWHDLPNFNTSGSFLRSKKTINVTISEVKPFKHPKKGTMLWRFTCSYGDGIILGPTSSSEMHAEVGTVIQVQPYGLHARDNGTIGWESAAVIKILEDGKPDEEKDIRKLIKKEEK